jgi:uncharacterized membrane protein
MLSRERLTSVLLLLGLGYLGFYVYSIVMGFFAPAELVVAGVIAFGVIVAFAVHAVRVRHALRDHDDPSHAALTHALHVHRERRGF